jgi:hypothetical protein
MSIFRVILPFRCVFGLLLAIFLGSDLLAAQTLAFPGAEGFGRFTSGGRGGEVIEVTNLNDSGAGSLRSALMARGPRTVVFRVSGTIYLNSDIVVSWGDLTVAGQTAPGDGICLANYSLVLRGKNIIIRFIRVRVGDQGRTDGADGRDAIFCRYTDQIIIDHCSFSWSIDETASAYFNTNFTMQWCIASESLRLSLHSKDNHGYGGIWGGQGATFHHNLFAHHTSRNPRLNGSRDMPATKAEIDFTREIVDLRNNVIYNWSSNSCYGGEPRSDGLPSLYNFVGNYYKRGPATPSSANDRIVAPTAVNGVYSHFYLSGNVTTASDATSADNWRGVDGPSSTEKATMRLDVAHASQPLTEQSAARAYEDVLQFVGACFPARDSVDERVLREVATGTASYGNNGIIDSQSEVGGWPTLNSRPAPADSDKDGMPNAWETARGLNPNNAADGRADPDGDGYTNLEDYLNGLVNHLYPQRSLSVAADASGVFLEWENFLNSEQLQQSGNTTDWQVVPGVGTGSSGRFQVTEEAAQTPQFYRVGGQL